MCLGPRSLTSFHCQEIRGIFGGGAPSATSSVSSQIEQDCHGVAMAAYDAAPAAVDWDEDARGIPFCRLGGSGSLDAWDARPRGKEARRQGGQATRQGGQAAGRSGGREATRQGGQAAGRPGQAAVGPRSATLQRR